MKKIIGISIAVLAITAIPFIVKGANNVDDAVAWMHDNGLTIYTNITSFKWTSPIRRDEASKLFSLFATRVLGKGVASSTASCSHFSDVSTSNTMRSYIIDTCNRGYILGAGGKFSPNSTLTISQAVPIIIRMLEGKKDESGIPRYQVYFDRADELGILSGINFTNKASSITRGTLAILLYRTSQLSDSQSLIGANNTTVLPSTKPDLTINSVGLDTTYPSPNVGDEAPYIKATIKNIGGSITFSSTNKMILSCGSAIKKEITNGTLGANQSMTIEGLTNLPGTYPNMFPVAKNNYTINCNVSLSSSTIYESNENNNSKSFSFAVGTTSPNIRTGTTNLPTTPQGFDLIINQINIDGNTPSLYDNKFFIKAVIKNIGNTNFLGNITFICEDYSIAEGQTLLTQRMNDTSINAGDSFTFSAEGLFSNFYNKGASKTISCVAGVTNDINPRNNSYSYSFDTIEKTTGIGDLSLELSSVDRINKKINFTIRNVGNGSMPGNMAVVCFANGDQGVPINAIQNIFVSYAGNTATLAPGSLYTETFDLSQYTYDDIDNLVCSVAGNPNISETSKSNNTVTLNYKSN